VLFDLVDFCRQCGIELLPPDAGSSVPVPPPRTADGVVLTEPGKEEARRSLELVERMIEGLLAYDGRNLHSMAMERFWTPDMRWYGPAGIGTTHGLDGFQAQHQGPFLKAFPDRYAGPHSALLAEGNYVCVTGWPSVIGTHRGDYLGLPATGRQVGMRVMDFWRRESDLLAENWVLIDMLDLFYQLGVDLLDDALRDNRE
jgi:predicted ester cyclase